ncbi:hypothetical protein C2E31_22590, partial [Rhodopirellula baltica]
GLATFFSFNAGAFADEPALSAKLLRTCETFVVEQLDDGKPSGTIDVVTAMKFFNAERVGSNAPVVNGALLLCIEKGRPIAAINVYPWDGNICHELDVLTSRPTFRIQYNAGQIWQPKESNLSFLPVKATSKPNLSHTRRLFQMKQLARRVTCTLEGFNDDNSDRQPLRLLPNPIYRYATDHGSAVGGTSDGAIFAFAQGNDPEVLLLIEATDEPESTAWRYGFVRASSAKLSAAFDDLEVWQAEKFPDDTKSVGAHYTVRQPFDAIDIPDASTKGK